jgi:HIRAN domain
MIVRTAIVGAKFRPPALGILSILPVGAKLLARREASNSHDGNAIQVVWPFMAETITDRFEVETRLNGYGSSLEELTGQKEWHLGYIPREEAAKLAPLMDKEGLAELRGSLFFSASGNAHAQFHFQEIC